MADFKSTPFKMVSVGRRVVKFDENGEYSTSDKDELEAFKKAVGVEPAKSKKEK